MGTTHPFRFGLQAGTPTEAAGWTELARKVEDLGFSSLHMPDHFGDQLSPIPALMAAADATTDLKLGILVLDNDFRHPVVLAKEIATLDVLSGGRVEFGLGAGWMVEDYEQSGIPYDSPKVRIDRFEESLAIIKGLWGDEPVTFAGEHYQISGLDGRPKPLQKPRPPILVGGGGKRMLSIAAREADIVGVSANLKAGRIDLDAAADSVGERYDEKLAWIKDAAGDRFDDLELQVLMFFVIQTDDAQGMAENLAPAFGVEPDQAFDFAPALFGTVGEMCERLQERRERWGISYYVCQREALDALAPVVAELAGT